MIDVNLMKLQPKDIIKNKKVLAAIAVIIVLLVASPMLLEYVTSITGKTTISGSRVLSGEYRVAGEGVLEIVDGDIVISQGHAGEFKIELEDSSTLRIVNSRIFSHLPFTIEAYDNSRIIIENSKIEGAGAVIVLNDKSTITASGSELSTVKLTGTSAINATGLDIDYLILYQNSSCNIQQSKISTLISYDLSGGVIDKSRVKTLYAAGNSSIALKGTLIENGFVRGFSSVDLTEFSTVTERISVEGYASLHVYYSILENLVASEFSTLFSTHSVFKNLKLSGKSFSSISEAVAVNMLVTSGAEIFLRNSSVHDLTANGTCKLHIFSSVVKLKARRASLVEVRNSSCILHIYILSSPEESRLTFRREYVSEWKVTGECEVQISNSYIYGWAVTVGEGVTLTIWDSELSLLECMEASSITARNCTIEFVKGEEGARVTLEFSKIGTVNVSRCDLVISQCNISKIVGLELNELDFYNSTIEDVVIMPLLNCSIMKVNIDSLTIRSNSSSIFKKVLVALTESNITRLFLTGAINVGLEETKVDVVIINNYNGTIEAINATLRNFIKIENGSFFRIRGKLNSSSCTIMTWEENCKVKREFIIIVQNDSNPLKNVNVTVYDANGNKIWSGKTDIDGSVTVSLLFEDPGTVYYVSIRVNNKTITKALTVLMDTPVIIDVSENAHEKSTSENPTQILVIWNVREEDLQN